MTKSTHYAKAGEVERKWVLIDADGLTLGRLATRAAMILRGKDKPQFTPNADTGDFVVVINADKVVLTGVKAEHKAYYRHSGYLGGLKKETYKEAMARHPEWVVEHAIKGMLPKTTLGRKQGMKPHPRYRQGHRQRPRRQGLLWPSAARRQRAGSLQGDRHRRSL